MKRGILKKFRNYLNIQFKDNSNWKHNQYHQDTRGYGDYLYFQDRCMFDVVLSETLKGNRPEYQDFLTKIGV